MKKFEGGIVVVIVLLSLIVAVNPVSAQPTAVWVDDDGPDNGK